jgi:alginate O-acetyltransferase complex protein AlgI
MAFMSIFFYVLLVPVALLFYNAPELKRPIVLLLLSYAFYAWFSLPYLALLIAASAWSYGVGLAIARDVEDTTKFTYLGLGVGALVAMIVGFKAAGAMEGILLPLGISYYSFKLIGYLTEVYWDKERVERDPILFFLFPAFFPQIISGPIQRADDFFRQVRKAGARGADFAQIHDGFGFVLSGLMLKLLISDRLSAFIAVIDVAHSDYKYPIVLADVCCYTLQLFADFAGYTNIAIGVGKIFGIDAPPNFAAPFAAPNIQEMWRRWHMSLTSWVTDYLFTPLSMSLRDLGRTGQILGIALSIVVIGLWHGFTINFLIFGLLHAFFVSVTALVLGVRSVRAFSRYSPASRQRLVASGTAVLGATLTFGLMTFSQIFFHSPTFAQATAILNQLLGLTPSGALNWSDIRTDVVDPVWFCAAVAYYVGLGAPGAAWLAEGADALAPKWLQYGVGLFLLSALSLEAGGKFVYGQF